MPDFGSLDEAVQAAFKPHYSDVVRRAARRRERRRIGAVAGVTALVVCTGAAAFAIGRPAGPGRTAAPSALPSGPARTAAPSAVLRAPVIIPPAPPFIAARPPS